MIRLRRLVQLVGRVSVRTKIMGMVLALTALLGLSVTWQIRRVVDSTLGEEIHDRGAAVISDIAGRSVEPILLDDTVAVHGLLVDTIGNHEDVLYAYLIDPAGHVIAHTFGSDGFPVDLLRVNAAGAPEIVFSADGSVVHDFAAPVHDGRLGTAHLGMTEERLRNVVDTTTGQMLLTTLAVSVIGIAAALFLTWLLTRPIVDLVSVTERVAGGDLAARAEPRTEDEIGVLASSFNEMVAELERSQVRLREHELTRTRLLHQTIDAQEDERQRISRELHDTIGQTLNSIALHVRSLDSATGDGPRFAELEGIVSEALQSVRQMSRELRPAALDDLGLGPALLNFLAAVREQHPSIEIDTHLDIGDRLDRAVETALYRMLQEAIINVTRHAQATTLSVVVNRRDSEVVAIVEDDGVGFDVEHVLRYTDSVGVHAIRERAELVGGSARFESGQTGTVVVIEVPGD